MTSNIMNSHARVIIDAIETLYITDVTAIAIQNMGLLINPHVGGGGGRGEGVYSHWKAFSAPLLSSTGTTMTFPSGLLLDFWVGRCKPRK